MTGPLQTITLNAFRGLRKLQLEGLGRINLLVGQTNSGKTSVLEALSLLSDPSDPMVWIHAANRREPSPLAAMMSSKVDRLRYLFPLYERLDASDTEISIDVTGTMPLKGLRASFAEIRGMRTQRTVVETDDIPSEIVGEVERTGGEIRVSVETTQPTLFQTEHVFQIWEGEPYYRPNRTSELRFPVRVVTPYEHWLRYPVARAFSDAVLAGEEPSVLALLRHIEPEIVDFKLLATQREPLLYLKNEKTGFLPISSFGDGIRRVITLAFTLPRLAGGIILVDEIETGLHFSILSKVYSWMVRACHQLNIQMFATTHSIEALDALLQADVTEAEDTVCFNLSRSRKGEAVIRYGEKQMRRLRSVRGLDLR